MTEQSPEDTVKRASEKMSGPRRPRPSLTGPMKSCPRARPSRQAVMLAWAKAVEMLRSFAISGRAGRYISVHRGPKAVHRARSRIA